MDKRIIWLCLAALLVIAPGASAAGARPWISGWLGGSTYAMEDVNDLIGVANASIAGSGLSMDDISKGFNYGGSFGIDLANNFSIGIGYDRLEGSTEVSDPTGKIEIRTPGNLFRGFGRYTFPTSGKTNGFLEASLGRVSSSGAVELSGSGFPTQTTKLEGSGLSFEGSGGVNVALSPQLDMVATLGYRAAKADDIKSDGQPLTDVSGGSFSIDWSGVVLRLGLTVAFSPKP